MADKTCTECGKTKPLSEFYEHPMMSDGHLNQCKVCKRAYARRRHYQKMRDPKWRRAERKRGREKARRYGYESETSGRREATAAQTAAERAIPSVPSGMERHHWSYNREHWTDVILLKIGYHRALHHQMTYDPRTRFFRTNNGHLLDTKRKHLRYAMAVWNERARYQDAA